MSEPRDLVIGRTWDGAPLEPADQATLRLVLDDAALRVEVDAPFQGDPPPSHPPGPTPGLWNHEVVELFVVAEGERYLEIELSPHGNHWVLRLEGIRTAVQSGVEIGFEAQIVGDRWRGQAIVDRAHLPDRPQWCNAFRIAGVGDQRRFHAWEPVPGPTPNFHRLHQFGPWPFAV